MRPFWTVTLVVLAGAFAGCTDEGPAPVGKDTYMLANTGAWSWSSGDGLASDLFRKADAFCRSRGRQLMPVRVASKDGGFNQFGHASLEFRCLNETDPQLEQPSFRNVPNVVIEYERR